MASLKLKKGFVVGFANWLNELSLSGKQSRERTRFVKLLTDEIQTIEEERKEIISKYVQKEEDGTTWKKTVDNSTGKDVEVWDIPVVDREKVNAETNDLYQEEFVVDITEANKERLAVIKDIVLNTDFKFGPKEEDNLNEKINKVRQAADYDFWCEAFESAEI